MGATAALLVGCGGSQQIAETASPQLRRSHGLLYVADYYPSAIDIFPLTGPNRKQIGSITNGVEFPSGLSIDANNSLYVANAGGGVDARGGTATVTVYPYGSTIPSVTYSKMCAAFYALADSAGHVFVSGYNNHRQGHVLEFDAGANRIVAHRRIGSEADGMAFDGQGNLYVAYRAGGRFKKDSIAEFGPALTGMRLLGMTIQQPQGLLVDHAGNIIVVESHAQRIDVFPPRSKTASVTVTIFGTSYLEGLAMQNSETTLWVSTWGGYVYSMPYPLTKSTVPTEYEEIYGPANGIAVTP